MKTIRQRVYFRQRVLKEVANGKQVSEVAIKHRVSRTSIYRWQKRYDGTVESLYELSYRPHRTFCSAKDANEQLRRYQRWGNNFPLLVLGRKSSSSIGGTISLKV